MKMLAIVLAIKFSLFAGQSIITPLTAVPYNEAKARLGKALFLDPRLSRDNTISCAHCHDLIKYGVDGLPTSLGVNGAKGEVNSPSVYNAVFHFAQFWDGRAKNLAQQAAGPIANPKEMASSLPEAIKKLTRDTKFMQQFTTVYPEGLNENTLVDAISEFEKGLVTLNSPFDRYLKGEKSALSKLAKEGYDLFMTRGCVACHNGVAMGGNMFQQVGLFAKLPEKSPHPGRFNVTKKPKDRGSFKVPSLRNVAKTAPYFHNGSVVTLEEAVKFMAKAQLGQEFSPTEVKAIVAFLESLTGEIPSLAKKNP